MLLKQAIAAADKRAARDDREWFVVYDTTQDDPPAQSYYPATAAECDTYYQGCDVVYSTVH